MSLWFPRVCPHGIFYFKYSSFLIGKIELEYIKRPQTVLKRFRFCFCFFLCRDIKTVSQFFSAKFYARFLQLVPALKSCSCSEFLSSSNFISSPQSMPICKFLQIWQKNFSLVLSNCCLHSLRLRCLISCKVISKVLQNFLLSDCISKY